MKKRLMLALASILTVALVATSLYGCGKKGEAVEYAGRYTQSQALFDGKIIDGEELTLNWPPTDNYIEIVDSQNINFRISGREVKSTYSLEGDMLRVNDTSGTVEFQLVDDNLIYRDEYDYVTDTYKYILYFTKT